MNKKQLLSLWCGIIVVVIGGVIAMSEHAYRAFYVWLILVGLVTGGIIYTLGKQKQKTPAPPKIKVKRHRWGRWFIALVVCLVLGVAWGLSRYPRPSQPQWWLSKASEIASDISDDYLKCWAYQDISINQAKMGNFSRAKDITAHLWNAEWARNAAYLTIIEEQAKRGDLFGARSSMKELQGEDASDRGYAAIAKGQAGAGNIAAAKGTASSIRKEYLKASFYEVLADEQSKAGDIESAKFSVADINDTGFKVTSYCKIAEAQVKVGQIREAQETFAYAQRIFTTFSKKGFECLTTSHDFLKVQAMIGDVNGAIETAKILGRDYDAIVEGQAQIGDIVAAKSTLQTVESHNEKVSACVAIAKAQAERGDIIGAKESLSRAMFIFMNIGVNEPYVRRYACQNVAECYAMLGEFPTLKKWAGETADASTLTNIYIGAAKGLIEKHRALEN